MDLDNAKKSKRAAAKKGQNAFSFMKAAQRRSAKAPAQKAKAKSKTKSKPRVKSSKQANPYKYNVSSHGQSLKSQKWSAERAKELPAMTEVRDDCLFPLAIIAAQTPLLFLNMLSLTHAHTHTHTSTNAHTRALATTNNINHQKNNNNNVQSRKKCSTTWWVRCRP